MGFHLRLLLLSRSLDLHNTLSLADVTIILWPSNSSQPTFHRERYKDPRTALASRIGICKPSQG